jgi:hypothetical protein
VPEVYVEVVPVAHIADGEQISGRSAMAAVRQRA